MAIIKTDPIIKLVDELPQDGVTVRMLQALDFVVPGEWHNLTGFENSIRTITGETDPARIEAISRRAAEIYADPKQGYQRAVWLYQTVDKTDTALAAAAFANKIGDKISFLSFLNRITPKADTSQAMDFGLKLAAEVVAYTQIHGLPKEGVRQFAQSLKDYSGSNIMRMAALVCVDGVLPLGPDFIDKVATIFDRAEAKELEQNSSYQQVSEVIPGKNSQERFAFIKESFNATKDWMADLRQKHNLTPSNIAAKLKGGMEFADDKLDYVAAFLDATTSYYQHTGTQTAARHLIERAGKEVAAKIAQEEAAQAKRREKEAEAKRRAEEAEAKRREEAALKAKAAATTATPKPKPTTGQTRPEQQTAPARPQPTAPKPQVRTYVVKSGDSLSKIAQEVYGAANRWPDIFEANKDKIKDPNLIYPGQELVIP